MGSRAYAEHDGRSPPQQHQGYTNAHMAYSPPPNARQHAAPRPRPRQEEQEQEDETDLIRYSAYQTSEPTESSGYAVSVAHPLPAQGTPEVRLGPPTPGEERAEYQHVAHLPAGAAPASVPTAGRTRSATAGSSTSSQGRNFSRPLHTQHQGQGAQMPTMPSSSSFATSDAHYYPADSSHGHDTIESGHSMSQSWEARKQADWGRENEWRGLGSVREELEGGPGLVPVPRERTRERERDEELTHDFRRLNTSSPNGAPVKAQASQVPLTPDMAGSPPQVYHTPIASPSPRMHQYLTPQAQTQARWGAEEDREDARSFHSMAASFVGSDEAGQYAAGHGEGSSRSPSRSPQPRQYQQGAQTPQQQQSPSRSLQVNTHGLGPYGSPGGLSPGIRPPPSPAPSARSMEHRREVESGYVIVNRDMREHGEEKGEKKKWSRIFGRKSKDKEGGSRRSSLEDARQQQPNGRSPHQHQQQPPVTPTFTFSSDTPPSSASASAQNFARGAPVGLGLDAPWQGPGTGEPVIRDQMGRSGTGRYVPSGSQRAGAGGSEAEERWRRPSVPAQNDDEMEQLHGRQGSDETQKSGSQGMKRKGSGNSLYSEYSYYDPDTLFRSPPHSRDPTTTSRMAEGSESSSNGPGRSIMERAKRHVRVESSTGTGAGALSPSKQGSHLRPGDNQPKTAEDHLSLGIDCHERGELERAAYHFKVSASGEGASAGGMLMYGLSLRHGWGCAVNAPLGFQYLERAARSVVQDLDRTVVDEKGRGVLSSPDGGGGEIERALERIEGGAKAVKSELVLALHELGTSYRFGWGVRKDKPTAIKYFELAAKLGDVDSQLELGFCYANGKGCKKDLTKAARYYRMACAQGAETFGLSWIYKDKYLNEEEKKAKHAEEQARLKAIEKKNS